jgi:hypothetical protein
LGTDYVKDLVAVNCIFDYGNGATGNAINVTGTNSCDSLNFVGCYAWAQEEDAITINNCKRFDWLGGVIKASSGHGLVVGSTSCDFLKIANTRFSINSNSKHGIDLSAGNINDVMLTDLLIEHPNGIGDGKSIFVNSTGGNVNRIIINSCRTEGNVKINAGSIDWFIITDNIIKGLEDYSGATNVVKSDNLETG